MKREIFICAFCFMIFSPNICFAEPVFIKGKSWSTGALPGFADMLALQAILEAMKLNDAQHTQAIIQEMKKGAAAEEKLLEHVSGNISAALQQYAVTQKRDQIRSTLTGPNAQPSSLCAQPEIAAGLQNAREAEKGITDALGKGYRQFEQSVLDATQNHEMLAAEVMPDDILSKTTLTEKDMAHAVEFGRRLTNPYPLVQKPSADLDAVEHQRAEGVRNLDMERRTPARALAQYDVAFRAPTAEIGALLKKQASEAGFQGTPPGLVNSGGAEVASWAAYYEYVRLSRTGNPNWYIELATKGSPALLREIAIMEAQQLDLSIRQHEILRLMAVATAAQLGIAADKARTDEGYHQ